MRFHWKTTPIIQITLYVLLALSVISVIFAILVKCDVRIVDITPGQASILIAVCPFTAIISILLSTICYKVDDKCIKICFCFVDVLGGRLQIDKILNVVITNGNLYISYLWKGPDPIIAQISISRKKYDSFVKLLQSLNKNIIYYNENENTDSDK